MLAIRDETEHCISSTGNKLANHQRICIKVALLGLRALWRSVTLYSMWH